MSSEQGSANPRPRATVEPFVPRIRDILKEIPKDHRPALISVWSDLRNVINAQEDTIQEMKAATTKDQMLEIAQRPATRDSVVAAREQLNDALDEAGQLAAQPSKTLLSIYQLDPHWVEGYLKAIRETSNELGCWLLQDADPEKYKKLNWRTKRHPTTGALFDCQPFAHQLAVVARNDGNSLLNVEKGGYEVSHRCHVNSCFNPAHVIVEQQELNKRRNQCRGSYIVECTGCGAVYHPCPHAAERPHFKSCLLTTRKLQGGKYHACQVGVGPVPMGPAQG